jgi:serine/threonine protein kinase
VDTLFRDIATGLMRTQYRGVLHCDLKPGNMPGNADHNSRLADFEQVRLVHERAQALGTLF